MGILYFIILLSTIITVHEIGHFVTAKKFNIYVPEFAIGMGPKLWQTKRGETKYTIRALPIGGYVSMAGEEGIDLEGVSADRVLSGISHTKRIIIMVAGAFMNLVLAWFIFVGIFLYNGKVVVPPPAVIGGVLEQSAAAEAGIQSGDQIQKVIFPDGSVLTPKNYYDFVNEAMFYEGTMQLYLQRGNEILTVTLTPQYYEPEKRVMMGLLAPQASIKAITPLEAVWHGTMEIGNSVNSVLKTLGKIVRGIGMDKLSGPVGIYEVTKEQASYGLIPFLALMGMLSVNIGIFNLLPLPILDGGRALMMIFEGVTKIKINEKLEGAFMIAGVVMMFALFIFVTYQDIVRLIGG